MSDIIIPDAIRPRDGRFGSGPTRIPPEHVRRLAAEAPLGTSHRRGAVVEMIGRLRAALAALFELPDGYRVVLGNGGATAFWEVAAFSLIERRSFHPVMGAFSRRFADAVAAAPHLDVPVIAETEPGTWIGAMADPNVDVYALIQNETSTGVAGPVGRPGEEGLVVVDATSIAGAGPVPMADIDAYYFSPQKAFASDGGLWVALLSPAALDRARSIAESGRYLPRFLSLPAAVDAAERNTTVNTPAVATLFLLLLQVEELLERGGLGWAAAHCTEASGRLYAWAEAAPYCRPFVADPSVRSPVTVTVELDGVDASEVASTLRRNGIVDLEGYRGIGDNLLRIGVWPATDVEDVDRLIASIEYVVAALG